jgi:hypothetical protein
MGPVLSYRWQNMVQETESSSPSHFFNSPFFMYAPVCGGMVMDSLTDKKKLAQGSVNG